MNAKTTKSAIYALVYVILRALHEAKVKGDLLGGVPNGHLYAQLMGEIDIDYWNIVVNHLVEQGVVTQENFLLVITEKGERMYQGLANIYANLEKRGM